jgi:hypothetical protein
MFDEGIVNTNKRENKIPEAIFEIFILFVFWGFLKSLDLRRKIHFILMHREEDYAGGLLIKGLTAVSILCTLLCLHGYWYHFSEGHGRFLSDRVPALRSG